MEKVTYNGKIYSRDPNSKNRSHRIYYRRLKYDFKRKKYVESSLHRVIWEDHNGPIPWDHIIHHIDGNSSNNDISNLLCIPLKDHLSKYHGEGKYKNSVEKSCMRCGQTFIAKTKRSKLCRNCSDIIYSSSEESRKWYSRDKSKPYEI
jgi:hypothetical protein